MEFFAFVALVALVGWVLGVVGFFQARGARRDLAALRRTLADGLPVTAEADPLAAYHADLAAGEAARPSPFGPRPEVQGSVPPTEPVAEPVMASMMPPPPPPDVPPPPPPEPVPAGPKLDIEALLTMRWGVWLGAGALLLSGVFLVRYAVEQGYLGPEVRSVLALLLAVALLGGAEWLRRRPAPALEGTQFADHAPAALAAGGAAVLFAAAYAVGPMYGLVPALVGFVLMGLASAVGIFASLRFGPMVGLVGVAAGFATPVLVETTTPWAPGLYGYLLCITAAACVVVRFSAWAWLGWIATVAGAMWVALAAVMGLESDLWAPGLFVPAAAALHLLLLPRAALEHVVGRRLSFVPFLVLGLAGVVLSGEVADFSVRLGVLLLAPLAVVKGAREPVLDRLPWLSALLFVLVLLFWALPGWQPTGELVTIEGAVAAFLPGAWAPEVIRPLLFTAAVMAAFFAVAGLAMQRLGPQPVRWAGLAATVPVVTLGVTYLQTARFQADGLWALAAGLLAAGLVAAAGQSVRAGERQRAFVQVAGVHAAGAVGALCIGVAVVLHDHWITLAVALFLPALAWIEARADLPPLRRVALAVAVLVMARLLLNWYVLDYAFGGMPVVNGLWLAYAVPAGCFWLAARMFLRRGDDLVVAVLEAGAVLFATVFVALQVRHWSGRGELDGDGSLLEFGLHVSAMGAQAVAGLFLARRLGRRVLDFAWRIQGVLALVGGLMLLVGNPVWLNLRAGQAALAFGYLVPAGLAGLAAMQPEIRRLLKPVGLFALVAGFAWISLEVRLLFHGGERLGYGATLDAEMWAYSGVWLGYGAVLMAAGIRFGARSVRLAALGVIVVVVGKVFLLDMSNLDGLWRVLSFLGLGLSLIGLGAVFRRFVVTKPEPEMPPAPP